MDPRDADLSTLLRDAVSDVEPADRLAEIRQATAGRPSRFRWYAAGGTVLAVSAAVTAIAVVTSPSAPKAEDPGPAAPSVEPSPRTHALAVYYVGDTPHGPRLFREFHQVAGGDDLAA